jgi:Spy/CpxP family protein refolding chaperone
MKNLGIAFFLIVSAIATPVFAQKVVAQKKQGVPEGTWWRNPQYVDGLSLTMEQQKRMDEVFLQSRIKLIDMKATLEKEETILEPLMEAEQLDEARAAAQIDKVANARAELEKANARMLLGIRQILTAEQWTRLNATKLVDKARLKGELVDKAILKKGSGPIIGNKPLK